MHAYYLLLCRPEHKMCNWEIACAEAAVLRGCLPELKWYWLFLESLWLFSLCNDPFQTTLFCRAMTFHNHIQKELHCVLARHTTSNKSKLSALSSHVHQIQPFTKQNMRLKNDVYCSWRLDNMPLSAFLLETDRSTNYKLQFEASVAISNDAEFWNCCSDEG